MKGNTGEWYQDDCVGGFYDKNGNLVVCEEYGISDRDCGRYDDEVLNDNGYYNEDGLFVRFGGRD